MSQTVKNYFKSIAPSYDFVNHVSSLNIDKNWRKKTIQAIKFAPEKKIKALDLCAGTLDLSLLFAKKFTQSQVYSLDFCYEMLALGQNKIAAKQKDQIHMVCGDALCLPFANEFFDLIMCGYGFRNLDDPQKAVYEMVRVLKPGGQILILDFFKPAKAFAKIFHQTYGKRLLPIIGGIFSKNKKAYQYLNDSIENFLTLEQMQKLLKENGLHKISARNFFGQITSLVQSEKPK